MSTPLQETLTITTIEDFRSTVSSIQTKTEHFAPTWLNRSEVQRALHEYESQLTEAERVTAQTAIRV
ncbi:hypothetical protein B9479_000304 [Cryptococcus floricola]|uniref:Uncharacterized protein n=1 Tax=Cryptococcus floricola TaxID=2591691 RepID=A0A5D3B7G2_9TREE|nr:hypothetical protein B9479_000304 [Cryptococcus floricola]